MDSKFMFLISIRPITLVSTLLIEIKYCNLNYRQVLMTTAAHLLKLGERIFKTRNIEHFISLRHYFRQDHG